jgi:hypothetical protein
LKHFEVTEEGFKIKAVAGFKKAEHNGERSTEMEYAVPFLKQKINSTLSPTLPSTVHLTWALKGLDTRYIEHLLIHFKNVFVKRDKPIFDQ